MPNYIDDDTALPATKANRRSIPPGGSATQYWQADDANAVFQFLEDARDAIQALQASSATPAVSIAKATWSGSQNLTTHGPIDWLMYNSSFQPSATVPTRTLGGNNAPMKRLGTHELAHSIDWITTATNSTFAASVSIAGGATMVTSDAGDSTTSATAVLSSTTGRGFNAGDGVNFGFTLRCVSASTQRTLKLFLGVGECTVTITAKLADGTVDTDTITVAAETTEAHLATITWTAGGCMVVSVMVTTQSSASGGGIYLYGAALS